MSTEDYRNDPATTAILDFWQPVASQIENTEDEDWFKVQLIAGLSYTFSLSGNENETLSQPIIQGLYDANGTLLPDVVSEVQADGRSTLSFQASQSGDYFVSVGTENGYVGAYEIQMAMDNLNLDSIANPLVLSEPQVHDLTSGQFDVYQTNLESNRSYSFISQGLDQAHIHIVDSNGLRVDSSHTNGRLDFSPAVTGDYFLLIGSSNGQSGAYQILSSPKIANGDMVTTELALAQTVSGDIETEFSSDIYRVRLEANQTYQIDMEGQETKNVTLTDAYLKGIYNPSGALIANARDDDGGEGYNARLFFTPEETGYYYIEAGAYDNRTGSYQLSINTITPLADDFGIGQSGQPSVGSLLVNQSQIGNIETASDQDGFQFNTRAGYQYQIDVEGVSNESGTLKDPFIVGLYDRSGTAISYTQDDDSGEGFNARYSFNATENDSFYVAVSSANATGTGTYTIKLTEQEVPVVFDDRSSNLNVTGDLLTIDGQALTGSLEIPKDNDWFKFTVQETANYRTIVKGVDGENSLVDPRLNGIYDSNGVWIPGTRQDDGSVLNVRFETILNPGDYFLSIDALNDQTGEYSVSVTTVLPDDYSNDLNTSGQITVGTIEDGRIEEESDKDWLKVSLNANNYYRIQTINVSDNADFVPVVNAVYNASGEVAFTQTDLDNLIIPSATADYFIEIASQDTLTGDYQVSVTQPEDISADKQTSGIVVLDTPVDGTIDFPDDEDWFKTSLTGGNSYHISLQGTGLNDPLISGIYNSSGTLISNTFDDDNGEGLNSSLDFTPSSSGNYFIAVESYDSGIGNYQLTVNINPNNYDGLLSNKSTLGDIKVGGSSLGAIEQEGDKDWFKMTLVANTTYLIGMEGQSSGKGTLADPVIDYVFNKAGLLIPDTQDNDSGYGKNALLEFTPTTSGDYFVSARGYYSQTGTYTLTLNEKGSENTSENTDSPPDVVTPPVELSDDLVSNKSTTGVVQLGVPTSGNIEQSNDKDWFKVALEANKTYLISAEGEPSEQGTLSDPVIDYVYNKAGLLVANTQDNDSGYDKNALLEFTPTSSSDYFVSIRGYYSQTGTYTVSVNEVKEDDWGSSISENTGPLDLKNTASGNIEVPNDIDWFNVSLTAGQSYTISLSGASDTNSLYDPYIKGIYQSDGSQLRNGFSSVSNNDAHSETKDSELTFTAEDTGTYYISVTGYDGSIGNYLLSIV
jgi:hypothetical protein